MNERVQFNPGGKSSGNISVRTYNDVQVCQVHELAVDVLESRVTKLSRVWLIEGTPVRQRVDASVIDPRRAI